MAKNNAPKTRAEEKAAAAQKRSARKEKAAAQAAAAEAARQAKQRKERLVTGGVVAAVIAVIVALVWWNVRDTGPVAAPQGISADHALVIGSEDAAHEIQVYEDFLCPACASLESATAAPFQAAADAGKARIKYYPLNFLSRLGDYSERATNAFAVVLDVEGAETAKKFHDLLFANQPSETAARPDNDWLVEKAVEAGADEDAVRPGIEDGTFNDWVEEATDAGSKAGVRATPTVKLDGQDWSTGDIAGLMEAIN